MSPIRLVSSLHLGVGMKPNKSSPRVSLIMCTREREVDYRLKAEKGAENADLNLESIHLQISEADTGSKKDETVLGTKFTGPEKSKRVVYMLYTAVYTDIQPVYTKMGF